MIGRRERLGIALVHGRLSMTVRSADSILRQQEHPTPIDANDVLVKALESLFRAIDFHGDDVSLVYASARGLMVPVRHPCMPTKDLRLLLARKAAAEWKEKEPMFWGFTRLRGNKMEENSLLHLVPAKPIDTVATWCRSHNMQPVLALSAAAAAISVLGEGAGPLRVAAVESLDSTTLLVGNSPTEVMLVRELSYSWNNEMAGGAERVAREIQRTTLFAKQQWSAAIESVLLIGKGAASMAETAKEITSLDCVVADAPMDWAGAVLDLSSGRHENLFPARVLGHKKRRRYSIALLLILFVFLCASLGSELLMHFLIRKADWELKSLSLQENSVKLLAERSKLQAMLTHIERNKLLDSKVNERALPAVPAWFTARLADAMPDGMSATYVDVHWDTTQLAWEVQVDGLVPRDPMVAAQSLEMLQARLQGPVLGMTVVQPWRVSWIANLRTGGTWEMPGLFKRYRLAGVFR